MPMLKRALVLGAALTLWSGSAYALSAKARTEAPGTPEQVWAVASDFCSIAKWHPSIAQCTTSKENGKLVRHLTLTGGGTIVEERTADGKLSYSYKILSSPLPVKNYTAKLWVEADDEPDRTAIYWSAHFDANGASNEDAVKTIQGILRSGVAGIKKLALKAADEREGTTFVPPKVQGQ